MKPDCVKTRTPSFSRLRIFDQPFKWIYSGGQQIKVKWDEISALVTFSLKSWRPSPPSPEGCSAPRPPWKIEKTFKFVSNNIKQQGMGFKVPSVGRCNQMCSHGPDDEEHRTDFQGRIFKIYNWKKAICAQLFTYKCQKVQIGGCFNKTCNWSQWGPISWSRPGWDNQVESSLVHK